MKRTGKAREVFKVKSCILKAVRTVNYVEVDLQQLKSGEYRAKIKTHLPRRKTAVAIKKDRSFQRALHKAQEANLKKRGENLSPFTNNLEPFRLEETTSKRN